MTGQKNQVWPNLVLISQSNQRLWDWFQHDSLFIESPKTSLNKWSEYFTTKWYNVAWWDRVKDVKREIMSSLDIAPGGSDVLHLEKEAANVVPSTMLVLAK